MELEFLTLNKNKNEFVITNYKTFLLLKAWHNFVKCLLTSKIIYVNYKVKGQSCGFTY